MLSVWVLEFGCRMVLRDLFVLSLSMRWMLLTWAIESLAWCLVDSWNWLPEWNELITSFVWVLLPVAECRSCPPGLFLDCCCSCLQRTKLGEGSTYSFDPMGDLVSDLRRLSVSFRLFADVHGFVLLRVLRVHVASNRLLVQGLVTRTRVFLLRGCVDLLGLLHSGFTAHQKVCHHVVLRRLTHARTVPMSLLARRVDGLLRRRHLNSILFGQHLIVILATRL